MTRPPDRRIVTAADLAARHGILGRPCAWCAQPAALLEHARPHVYSPFGRYWHPACPRCHRWLIGVTGTVGLDDPTQYRPIAELRAAAAADDVIIDTGPGRRRAA